MQNDRRILVAVEDPALRAYARRCIDWCSDGAWRVDEAADGARALRRARQRPIDLVICAVVLPRLDGLELVEELADDERLASTPVLLLTNEPLAPAERARLARARYLEVLENPFNARTLCESVTRLLA